MIEIANIDFHKLIELVRLSTKSDLAFLNNKIREVEDIYYSLIKMYPADEIDPSTTLKVTKILVDLYPKEKWGYLITNMPLDSAMHWEFLLAP